MLQVIEQSEEEKMAMYMKLLKKELAIMLISCNTALDTAIKNCNLPCVTNHVKIAKFISTSPKFKVLTINKEYEIISTDRMDEGLIFIRNNSGVARYYESRFFNCW